MLNFSLFHAIDNENDLVQYKGCFNNLYKIHVFNFFFLMNEILISYLIILMNQSLMG